MTSTFQHIKTLFKHHYLLFIFLFVIIGYAAIPLPSPLFPNNYSTVVLGDSSATRMHVSPILRVFLNRDEQWCLPPSATQKIPAKLTTAVLTYEDQYFYYHPGINLVAVARAIYQNLTAGRTVSGASTITMQVTRLMRPKKRSYFNKILEIFQALKIELHYPKNDILKLYLDHAPYGGNVIGYMAASLRYFGKLPTELTWGEAATLAVLPNAPGLISPDIDPAGLRKKRDRLLKKLYQKKIVDRGVLQLSLLEPVPSGSRGFPMLAPHLSQFLKEKNGKNGGVIQTTIQPALQKQVEQLLKQQTDYLSGQGIHNGAVLVAETKSGKVRAYAGSQNFFDNAHQGQVDGVRAPRSSGSLLKPFLYALAFDDGIILPQTVLKDVPTFYGAFSPSNADEKFSGLVTAKQALIQSLNVPAVRLLYTYGIFPFYIFLKSAGVSTLFRNANDYGLPLVLGGSEVTLWDMAALYRGLGLGGKFSKLQILENDTANPGLSNTANLISPGASYLALNILRELKRPGSEYYWELFQNQFPLAWKTGTSYGQKDAWAVGVSPQWTIAVWIGNFSGEGNANLAGARCAGPLLFDIFNNLPQNPQKAWFAAPDTGLKEISVCLETGFVASPNCPNPVVVSAPRYMKPLRLCPFHQKIFVSTDTGDEVCSICWTPGHYTAKSMLMYPPDVAQYLRRHGQNAGSIPLHNPKCPAQSVYKPLEILYPLNNARLWVPRDFDGEKQKVTTRAAHRDQQRTIFWYLNDHYLGSTTARHEMAVLCKKGWNQLEIVDEIGYRDHKRFYVDMKQ